MIFEALWLLFMLFCIVSVIVVTVRDKAARKKTGQQLANNMAAQGGNPNPAGGLGEDFAPEPLDFDENSFK